VNESKFGEFNDAKLVVELNYAFGKGNFKIKKKNLYFKFEGFKGGIVHKFVLCTNKKLKIE
jgi:hypothetical protein